MPAVKTLRLRNFRSVGDNPQEIALGKRVTIFMGPNNSGKSNILRALSLVLKTSFRQPNSTEAHPYDFHKVTMKQSISDSRTLSSVGNCEIYYSFTEKDVDATVTHLIDSIYSYLRYDRNKETVGRSRLSRVVAEYFMTPFRAAARLEKADDKVVLTRISTGPSWLLTDKDKQKRIDEYMENIDELLGYSDNRARVFEEILQFAYPKLGVVPRGPIPLEPQRLIPFGKIRNSTPTPDTLRSFLAMMKDDELKRQTDDTPFSRLVGIIRKGFPQIESIDAGIDPETGKARVMIVGDGHALEVGYQGDGLKELLMFIVFLTYFQGDVIIVDEPERYMHPEIEASLISYFFQFGRGQLVLATHSESIVNSVPSDDIDSGQVLIYGVSQNKDGLTTITRESESGIIRMLERIGVSKTRYVKHMAALSRTLVFVEGTTDKRMIQAMLSKHGRIKDLDRFSPYFIPMEGTLNFSKLSANVIDSIAKGDDELDSPLVPYLILRDLDEGVQESGVHELVLSVREIENLVIQEDSIVALAEEYLSRLELEAADVWRKIFEEKLSDGIRSYSYKWALLVIRKSVNTELAPLRKFESIGSSWEISKIEALDILDKQKQQAIEGVTRASEVLTEKNLDRAREDLLKGCFNGSGNINYPFTTARIPGKDFIRSILREALIGTASALVHLAEMAKKPSDNRIRGLAGSLSNFDGLLKYASKLPTDLERFLQRLEMLQVQ